LKYLRSATFGFKDIVIRKSEFVAMTQFLCTFKKRAGRGMVLAELLPKIQILETKIQLTLFRARKT